MKWVGLVVMLWVSGCTQQPPANDQQAAVVSDSMGVTLVMNHAPNESFKLVVGHLATVRIEGDVADALLHNIVGAARLSDGRIVVLNGAPVQMRVHNRTGRLEASFSRQGQGPFEFRAPMHFRVLPGDTIVGWDAMFGSAYGFLPTGAPAFERHVDLGRIHETLGRAGLPEDGTPLPGVGYLVQVGLETSSTGNSTESLPGWQRLLGRVRYAIVTTDFRRIDLGAYSNSPTVLRREPHGWVAPMYFYLSHAAHAARDERIYLSDAMEHRIDAWGLDGQLHMSIRRTAAVRELDDSVFEAGYARWRGRYQVIPDDEFKKAVALLPPLRELPPLLGLLTDPRGWIWARDTPDQWSVFDKAGKWLTTMQLPLHRVYEIGDDYVLGVELDEDDVPSILELPLTVEPRRATPTPAP